MIDLFPYQLTGADWLSRRRLALLGDDMGLGKTAQAIRAADLCGAHKILVVCPGVARPNWVREFEKFSMMGRKFRVIESASDYEPSMTDSMVVSYDIAAKLLVPELHDVLIMDEAHYLKNPERKRTQAIYGKRGLVHLSKRVWALSGTPAENHAAELWPLLYTFGATKLGYNAFVDRYCHSYASSYNTVQISGTKRHMIPELHSMLAPVMLRRLKRDVLKDLPPLRWGETTVARGHVDLALLGPDAAAKIARETEMVENALAVSPSGMAYLEAISESVATLRRYLGLQKIDGAASLVASEIELGLYNKVVLFAVHTDVIEGLERRLSRFNPVKIYGATTPQARQAAIDRFQNDNSCHVFIGNIQACGTAITLTAAHDEIFVEQEWTPGKNRQAADRCHRIGQVNAVLARVLTVPYSLDQSLSQILMRKTQDLSGIIDGVAIPTPARSFD
jgi:SWI/SNF-related matrix-associated actin-dependent regulator 1 of chromatin subfamily A